MLDTATVQVGHCDATETGCPGYNDNTGYKVWFNGPAKAEGETTIQLTATGNNSGATTYSSFTLRWARAGANPPTIQALPNATLQLEGATGKVTYTANFAIEDLGIDAQSGQVVEDVETIYGNYSTYFTVTSSNPALLPSGNVTLTQLPPPTGYINPVTHRQYSLAARTNATSQAGFTVVTVTLHDPDLPTANYTDTSFVLQVVPFGNTPPTIQPASTQSPQTYLPYPVPTPTTGASPFNYVVTSGGDSTHVEDLRITATSSNTNLIPHLTSNLVASSPTPTTGVGTITVVPITPLPSPSPGIPQSATITLNVTDDQYTRSFTFLVVAAANQNGVESLFSRPMGVYNLDPDPTSGHRPGDNFLTGEMHRISWNKIEVAKNGYNFPTYIDPIFTALPPLQDVSLNLVEEPCYILGLTNPTTKTWCDTRPPAGSTDCTLYTCNQGTPQPYLRPVPWDKNLMTRRESYISALALYLQSTIQQGTSELAKVSIINTNLPGGDSGIRNADGQPFSATQGPPNYTTMQGYSRPVLLGAIQHELRTVQDVFLQQYSAPILLQIGFFLARDDLGPTSGGCTGSNCGTYSDELWQWLYKEAGDSTKGPNKDANGNPAVALYDEFNGVIRPRVAFFQEDLAAARNDTSLTPAPRPASPYANYITWPLSTAYTFTPSVNQLPTFSYWAGIGQPQSAAIYNNAIVYQANCPWTSAFAADDGAKFYHTLNGTPNDGMEAAFNAYLNEYFEIYPPDIDEAQPQGPATLDATLWASELQSWHDYYKDQRALSPRATEAPAGLSVAYQDSTHFVVSWYAMYGANAYTLQSRAIGTGPAPNWVDATGCTPASTSCTVALSQPATQYSFRVMGKNTVNGTQSAWANAAIFLSEAANDGYVIKTGTNYSANSNDTPGIRAGEGTGMPLPHWRGILSFNTGALSSVATSVLGAKLRLHQATAGTNITPSHSCMVDMKLGTFGNLALEGTDYTATETTTDVFNVLNVGANNWFEWSLTQATAMANIGIGNTSTTDHTQLRIYFNQAMSPNKNEGWDSGESTTSPPQLIVQYQ